MKKQNALNEEKFTDVFLKGDCVILKKGNEIIEPSDIFLRLEGDLYFYHLKDGSYSFSSKTESGSFKIINGEVCFIK